MCGMRAEVGEDMMRLTHKSIGRLFLCQEEKTLCLFVQWSVSLEMMMVFTSSVHCVSDAVLNALHTFSFNI